MRRVGLLLIILGCTTEPRLVHRVVTFGDSNTDYGYDGDTIAARSYIHPDIGASPDSADSPLTLAGKLDAMGFPAVNHGSAGTGTDTGRYYGTLSPNARESINGVTRFEAEVLGRGYPWSGGEPTPIVRVQAFSPGPDDFAYVSIGTNDTSAVMTARNLRWMIDQWPNRRDHFILTTLAPRFTNDGVIPAQNDSIRAIANSTGVQLIDLGLLTSADNGHTWRSDSLHVGDFRHYTSGVRAWIAGEIRQAIVRASR